MQSVLVLMIYFVSLKIVDIVFYILSYLYNENIYPIKIIKMRNLKTFKQIVKDYLETQASSSECINVDNLEREELYNRLSTYIEEKIVNEYPNTIEYIKDFIAHKKSMITSPCSQYIFVCKSLNQIYKAVYEPGKFTWEKYITYPTH